MDRRCSICTDEGIMRRGECLSRARVGVVFRLRQYVCCYSLLGGRFASCDAVLGEGVPELVALGRMKVSGRLSVCWMCGWVGGSAQGSTFASGDENAQTAACC